MVCWSVLLVMIVTASDYYYIPLICWLCFVVLYLSKKLSFLSELFDGIAEAPREILPLLQLSSLCHALHRSQEQGNGKEITTWPNNLSPQPLPHSSLGPGSNSTYSGRGKDGTRGAPPPALPFHRPDQPSLGYAYGLPASQLSCRLLWSRIGNRLTQPGLTVSDL